MLGVCFQINLYIKTFRRHSFGYILNSEIYRSCTTNMLQQYVRTSKENRQTSASTRPYSDLYRSLYPFSQDVSFNQQHFRTVNGNVAFRSIVQGELRHASQRFHQGTLTFPLSTVGFLCHRIEESIERSFVSGTDRWGG